MILYIGSVVWMLVILTPSDVSVHENPPESRADHGPAPLIVSHEATPPFRLREYPKIDSPQPFELAGWSVVGGRLSLIGRMQAPNYIPGLTYARFDEHESGLGLAWSPRSSRLSFFIAMRLIGAAVVGKDGVSTKMGMGPVAGITVVLPSLVNVVRRWQARQ